MTITLNKNLFGIVTPKLHRVVYVENLSGPAYNYESQRDVEIFYWLKENCNHKYYMSPGYYYEKFIEFECDEDATFFKLRWG